MGKLRPKVKDQNDTLSKWYLLPQKARDGSKFFRIRRCTYPNGKQVWENYPIEYYGHLDESDIRSLVNRLNSSFELDRKAAADRYVFDHSYVNIKSMNAFESQLDKNISDPSKKGNVIHMLNSYVFEFFIVLNKLPDPTVWYTKEDEWGKWLLKKELSPASIRLIVSTANRFNKFLIDRMYPEMATPRKLEPIGKLKLDKISNDRKKVEPVKFIKPDAFERMIKVAKVEYPEIVPNMVLAYQFGLRISETLGLTKDKFLKDSLLIDEQGDRIEGGEVVRKSAKTNERRVPYWNMSAKEAWKQVQDIKPMHPDTLIKKVNDFLVKYNHTSHDFRRSFITNSLRKNHWKDVQEAAGHTDVRTTMGYNQDDRNLSEEKAELD